MLLVAVVTAFSFTNNIMVVDDVLRETECAQIRAQAGHAPRTLISQDPTWKAWDERLHIIFGDAIQTYASRYDASVVPPISKDVGYVLMSRDARNGTLATYIDQPRFVVSAVLFLNDDVAGGAWEFLAHNPIDVACGRMIIYPSGYTHPRGAKPVRLGTQWFILTWFTS